MIRHTAAADEFQLHTVVMSDEADRTEAAAVELANTCAAIVGPRLTAGVLHGSLTLGDFAPGRSDIDLMLITGSDGLSGIEREQIIEAVSSAKTGAANAIDLIAVNSTVARNPTRAPACELQLARYPDELHVEDTNPADEDLAVELSMARAAGRSLTGISVAQAIGPVPDRWVKDRGIFWLRRWLTLADDAEHAELMVLTACRIWHFDTEGTYSSKPRSGKWALDRDPSLTGVTQALRRRQGEADASIPAAAVTHVLRTVLSHVTTRP